MEGCTAVVHTVGTLLEMDYKKFLGPGKGVLGVASSMASSAFTRPSSSVSYETVNRDAGMLSDP